MRNLKVWLVGAVVAAGLAGVALMAGTDSTARVAAQEKGVGDHWRWHDGHWSYYYPADRRWYYTDGKHWYFNDHKKWSVYRFDREFGRKNFERGEYRHPVELEKVVVPRHEVYRPR